LIHKHDILAVLSGGADQWNAFRRRHTESIGLRLLTQAAQAAVKRKTAILAVPRRLFLRFQRGQLYRVDAASQFRAPHHPTSSTESTAG
jgi:hypothetical protein